MPAPRVAFTAYNRPGYLAESLSSWARARGAAGAHFSFCVDPSDVTGAVTAVIAAVPGAELCVNAQRLGTQRNPYRALCRAFAAARPGRPDDFVILAEDDFVVSEDILEYFGWAQREFYGDARVLAVSAAQFEPQGSADEVLLLAGWTGWVWGTWRDRWENCLRPDWTFGYEHGGWDWRIIRHWCGSLGYATAVPALSRSQHIGQHGGVHTDPATWHEHVSRCYTPQVPPQRYRRRQPDVPQQLPCHHDGT